MPYIARFVKADGTVVRGHYRWAAGARHEMAILAVAVAAIAVIGNGNVSSKGGQGHTPRPQKTGSYPITFADKGRAVKPRPQKSVTYPIRFPKVERKPVPRPSVVYPIRFETNGSGR
ncbi:hypothetical protein [Streptomyces sp. NPDC006638]|uniref:hypothetical protein n=1 Tax=Streptomyces sp. NPDC006638 TaxID=3157183 RepID=UPI0033BC02A5